MKLWVLVVSIVVFAERSLQECTKDAEIIKLVVKTAEPIQPASENPIIVTVGLKVSTLSTVPHTNSLHVDGTLTRSWKDPTFYFSHLNPCSESVNIAYFRNKIWIPELENFNADDIIVHRHSVKMQMNKEGVVTHSERIKLNIPCLTTASSYPFGNTTCALVWRNELQSRNSVQMQWDDKVVQEAKGEERIKEAGDLELMEQLYERHELFLQNGVFDTLKVIFNFRRGHHKLFMLFYLPAFLFMFISWMSLLLGPMSITRSVLLTGSLILLLMHYYTNMAGLPVTTGITSIDLWKIFSLLFVVAILMELVIVTCMASAGRSRRFTICCNKRKRKTKGKYELEPQYEELNDLRTRKTRRTSGCCRYSALFLDFASFWVFAAIFLAFVFFMYMEGPAIVRWINEVDIEDLKFA